MHDHAANAAVAHEQIRAAADDEERQIFAPAKANQLRKSFLGSRLDPELRRSADPQGGVFRERFGQPDLAFRPDDFFQLFRDDQLGGERGQLFVNIAGAETEHEIAVEKHVADVAVQPIEPRLIGNRAMSVREIASAIVWPLMPGNAGLARRVNIGDDDMIGVVKGAAKFVPQRLGARITMRLKHRQDAFAAGRFRGRERGADLGRMMRVIVDEEKAIALIFDLEAAARVAKSA